MPTIYPQIISEKITSDARRRAELEVLDALRATLPKGFHIFYNCDWHYQSETSNRQDGEADFIIAHENLGIAVLEVKGGVISRDSKDRQWHSRDRAGNTHAIKNPIHQARDSKHVILQKLKESLGSKLGFIQMKHAAVFPDSGKPKSDADLGADMPLDLLFFMEDIPVLGKRILKLLLDSGGTNHANLGKAGIEVLRQIFNGGFLLEPRISSAIKSCEFKIRVATDQQKKLLKLAESANRLTVSGGAGTGKTSLVIEKAKSLDHAGKKTLLLCFNAPLCAYLREVMLKHPNVDVNTFHQFCLRNMSVAGIPAPANTDQEFWAELPYLLLEALQSAEAIKYDAIIIDEGQDFHKEWIEAALAALKDPAGGVFYLFYDDNQKLYPTAVADLSQLTGNTLRLFENVRNAKPIFETSSIFYSGGELQSLGPDGLAIDWESASADMRDRALEKILNRLINNEGVTQSEIAVLTAKPYETYSARIGHYQCCRAEELKSNAIVFDSIYRFKGLEREVVILIDLGTALEKISLLYVGFSRARSLLAVLDTPETIRYLKAHTMSA